MHMGTRGRCKQNLKFTNCTYPFDAISSSPSLRSVEKELIWTEEWDSLCPSGAPKAVVFSEKYQLCVAVYVVAQLKNSMAL